MKASLLRNDERDSTPTPLDSNVKDLHLEMNLRIHRNLVYNKLQDDTIEVNLTVSTSV